MRMRIGEPGLCPRERDIELGLLDDGTVDCDGARVVLERTGPACRRRGRCPPAASGAENSRRTAPASSTSNLWFGRVRQPWPGASWVVETSMRGRTLAILRRHLPGFTHTVRCRRCSEPARRRAHAFAERSELIHRFESLPYGHTPGWSKLLAAAAVEGCFAPVYRRLVVTHPPRPPGFPASARYRPRRGVCGHAPRDAIRSSTRTLVNFTVGPNSPIVKSVDHDRGSRWGPFNVSSHEAAPRP